jgi:hypothetical protein
VSGLTYDTGALLAAEANNRRMWALHRRVLERSHTPTIPAAVLAQAWRGGPQPLLSQLLDTCAVENMDAATARLAGAMLSRAANTDVVDASVVVGALRRGDAIITSDRADLGSLAHAVGRRINIIGI